MVHEIVALGDPVGVLHADTHIAPRPVLCLEVTAGVVHLEHLVCVEAVAWRHEIERNKWVHVLTL